MTSLSQYLSAEQPDPTEPASFYVPGAKDWQDHDLKGLRARRKRAEEQEVYVAPDYWDGDEE